MVDNRRIGSTSHFMEVDKVANGFEIDFVDHGRREGKRLRKPKAYYKENDPQSRWRKYPDKGKLWRK